ncbi:MAG TPA: GDP-mannose 4,6-dehydratase [Vicinamibacterales bacterium]|nr:GDP-mannose 4,6-dehydratase [Vicinamibacterales bacterium]
MAGAASPEGPVLITGAAGFAGSHLADLLAATPRLVCWSREAPAPGLVPSAHWQQIDLLDRDHVRAAVRTLRPAQIYHLAGVPHVGGSWEATSPTLAGNVLATHYLFDALRRAGVRARVLVTASATVYAPSDRPIAEDGAIAPGSPYALSKLAQEMRSLRATVEDGLDVVVVRAFNHTGPRQTPAFAAPSFARQIAAIERGEQGPVIKAGNLTPRRDLSDVRDVVRAYVALMQRGAGGAIYNVASGVGRPIGDILHALVARARVKVTVETDPALLRPNDTAALVGDCSRLQRDTGWTPRIPFEQMLDDLLEYWRLRA